MAGKQVCLLMAIVVIAGISSICSAQRAHIVGGTTGWTIPPSTTFYTTWASRETFQVGDVLGNSSSLYFVRSFFIAIYRHVNIIYILSRFWNK